MPKPSRIGFLFVAAAGALAALPAAAETWLNVTGTVLECDFCSLQSPHSVAVAAGQATPLLYGRLFEAGVTEPAGVAPTVLVQLGFGPLGTYPLAGDWHWSDASFSAQVGTDDEFSARITPSLPGVYGYTFRYSLDNGASFTIADMDGVGSMRGNSFDITRLGTLVVSPAVPEPSTYAMLVAGLVALALRMRRR